MANSNKTPNSYDDLAKKHNCVKCTVKIEDLKLITLKYWKVKITKQDVSHVQQALKSPTLSIKLEQPSSVLIKSNKSNSLSLKKTTKKIELTKKKKKKRIKPRIQSRNNSFLLNNSDIDDYSIDTLNLTQTDNIFDRLYRLEGDQLKLFNFTICNDLHLNKTYKTRIDESILIEKFLNLQQNKPFNTSELKKDQIVWSQWRTKGRNLWWPSRIIKIISQKNAKHRVYIRYYEMSQRVGNLFKLDVNKIEPFYSSIENHYSYKLLATEFKPQRFEFFTAYSNALVDFQEQCIQNEQNNETQTNSLTNHLLKTPTKYLVHGRMITLDEIQKTSTKSPSKRLVRIIEERLAYSKSLINLILTNECKQFIVSILLKQISCKRSRKYLGAKSNEINALKCEHKGPLIEEHQKDLKYLLYNLSREYFSSKPTNLNNYENDVLYPEAVIWAIKKQDKYTDTRAEKKFQQGFHITEEEIIKQKCFDFVQSLPKTSRINDVINNEQEDELTADDLAYLDEDFVCFNEEKPCENDSLFDSESESLNEQDDIEEMIKPVKQFLESAQECENIFVEPEVSYTENNIDSVESGYDVMSPDNIESISAIIDSLMTSSSPKSVEENCYYFEYDVVEQNELENIATN